MSTAASSRLTPARLDFNAEGIACAPDYGDVYHTAAGAFAQADHVFLRGNGLPQRWQGQARFVILETGFGLGNNFLATWSAWRQDPQRCERLIFISLEKHPLRLADLQRVHQHSEVPELAAQLIAQWPLATPDLHSLDFEEGRVQLLLVWGDARETLPQLRAQVNAFFLDGFAPARNADLWSEAVWRRLPRLAAPGATAATWSAARVVRDGLTQAGFTVELAPGFGGKRDITVARFAPRFVPPWPVAWRPLHEGPREALIIGGGLAGCASAWALARQGWHSTVLERAPRIASQASGNPGGLMHGIFNAPDSHHSAWLRAAASLTARLARPALAVGVVAGKLEGFVRVEPRLTPEQAQAQLDHVGLPTECVRWLTPQAVAQCTGLPAPTQGGAWWFGEAGWLSPVDWCAWLLAQAEVQGLAQRRCEAEVAQLRFDAVARQWLALDVHGRALASAPVVVLANAFEVHRLLPPQTTLIACAQVRGQISRLPAHLPGLCPPRVPVSGQGYGLHLPSGDLVCGATTQPDDVDPTVRWQDHRHNLDRAAALGLVPAAWAGCDSAQALGGSESFDSLGGVEGRVGWRAVTRDRLPVIGAVPWHPEAATVRAMTRKVRRDAPQHHPRCQDARHGVFVLTGLGSRGLTSAVLAAQVLASDITGAPLPVRTHLYSAIDAGRGHFTPSAA